MADAAANASINANAGVPDVTPHHIFDDDGWDGSWDFLLGEPTVTPDDLRALLRLAGLSLDQPEIDELLPLYRLLRQRADTLHEADLPLSVPSAIFPADWRG